MSESGLDRLNRVLVRARHSAEVARAAEQARAKRKVVFRQRADINAVSADYADRLMDRSYYRRLLQDNRLDGERFRFYFSEIEKSTNLDQLRAWIDAKMAKKENAA